MYDYLIVGSGLFGAVFAYEANKKGKKCMVIEKRSHIGGNIYTENIEGINVHKYGAHIFHTSNKKIWDYVNKFADFNRYTNSPVARYKNELYNLPFNMNTFNKLWGVITPKEARDKIEKEKKDSGIVVPKNLEEQAISLIGKTIYEKLVKGYTEKQWGKRATELPNFIIKRLPVRFTYDNNYFDDLYQGIPIGGYTQIIEKMLKGIEVKLNCDFFENREIFTNLANKIIFTGPVDKYYNYKFGELEYRSLRFETQLLNLPNYQGNAVVNYTEYDIPYTRIIEHKHFEFDTTSPKTIITREYPDKWNRNKEPYYTINDEKNDILYKKYYQLSNDYVPEDLVDASTMYAYSGIKLSSIAYEAFKELFNAAKSDGYTIVIGSGYRSYDSQEAIYERNKNNYGTTYADNFVARPGHSEHQTGLALDVADYNNSDEDFEKTEAYQWMLDNAHKYGFILRYPKDKEDITGYSFESWHFRYVGVEVATKIHNLNITYDEYYAYFIENK